MAINFPDSPINGATADPGNGVTYQYSSATDKWTPVGTINNADMILSAAQQVTGAKTFEDATLLLENVAGTFNARLTNTVTADRVHTLQDADGTLAHLTDITGTNSGTNTGDETLSSINALAITTVGTISSGVWQGTAINQTYLEGQSGTNTGDETDMSGISDTKANFDASLSDGTFMYTGDAPTAHTHLLAAGATDVTASAAELNLLNLNGLTAGEALYADSGTTASWRAMPHGLCIMAFDTGTTDADPGTNNIRQNNAAAASTTFLYADDNTVDMGTNMGQRLWSLLSDNHYIMLVNRADPTDYQTYHVTGVPTDGTGYWKIPVTNDGWGVASFAAGTQLDIKILNYQESVAKAGDTMTGDLTGGGNALIDFELDDTFETFTDSGTSGAGTVTFTYSTAQNYELDITGNCTFAFAGWPATGYACMVLWLYDGGDFTPVWPTIKWANNTAPVLSSNLWDKIVIETRNGGTTLMGTHAGVGYPI
jgi:hypothetical protein